MNIINETAIFELLHKYNSPDSKLIDDIVQEAKLCKGITLAQAATLINTTKPEDLEKIFEVASYIKDKIYGKRVVLFAPLYVSNFCTNNCLYCGFRVQNRDITRIVLSEEEIHAEVKEILKQGHKRVLMLMGEHNKKSSLEYFIQAIDSVYSVKDEIGSSIRRINVEIEPLTNEEFQMIKNVPIGTYTVFQETYHKQTYEKVHLSGKKADYNWRLEVMHRALSNGLGDIGIGALFGLYDYRFEVLGLLSHSFALYNEYGIGPHTISIPRLQYAQNAPESKAGQYTVSDNDFKKLVAVIRLAVPYTGMILSTRESSTLRMELLKLGISQISAGSRTNPGGYKQAYNAKNTLEQARQQTDGQYYSDTVLDETLKANINKLVYKNDSTTMEHSEQFSLNDTRTSGEIIRDVINQGFVPSFCTACYRVGRVGEKFMQIARGGNIKPFCQTNSLLTLQEYISDYAASDKFLLLQATDIIERELHNMDSSERAYTIKLLDRIKAGERDIYR